jgi:hypothetical protein
MNSRRLTSDIRHPPTRLGPPPVRFTARSACARKGKVLGLNLNRSESTWALPTPLCFQPNDSIMERETAALRDFDEPSPYPYPSAQALTGLLPVFRLPSVT